MHTTGVLWAWRLLACFINSTVRYSLKLIGMSEFDTTAHFVAFLCMCQWTVWSAVQLVDKSSPQSISHIKFSPHIPHNACETLDRTVEPRCCWYVRWRDNDWRQEWAQCSVTGLGYHTDEGQSNVSVHSHCNRVNGQPRNFQYVALFTVWFCCTFCAHSGSGSSSFVKSIMKMLSSVITLKLLCSVKFTLVGIFASCFVIFKACVDTAAVPIPPGWGTARLVKEISDSLLFTGSDILLYVSHPHEHTVLMTTCPIDVPSSFIPRLCSLLSQTQTFHIFLDPCPKSHLVPSPWLLVGHHLTIWLASPRSFWSRQVGLPTWYYGLYHASSFCMSQYSWGYFWSRNFYS